MDEDKKQFLVALFGGIIIIGLSVYAGTLLVLQPEITEDDIYYFKAGYHDTYINIARAVIRDCGNYPVRIVEQIRLDNSVVGILFWCQRPDRNLTVPIPYSKLYYKNNENENSTRIVYR